MSLGEMLTGTHELPRTTEEPIRWPEELKFKAEERPSLAGTHQRIMSTRMKETEKINQRGS